MSIFQSHLLLLHTLKQNNNRGKIPCLCVQIPRCYNKKKQFATENAANFGLQQNLKRLADEEKNGNSVGQHKGGPDPAPAQSCHDKHSLLFSVSRRRLRPPLRPSG